ncbi:MAG: putative rane protein [Gemmatimonadetes bacterium]|nr:putative rane protein [Gemmatimonadota bacterium]
MRAPRDDQTPRRDFRAKRWLSVMLRTWHLMSVIALGALLLGAAPLHGWPVGRVGGAVVVSGLAMLALDLYASQLYLRTVAGVTALLKLVLVAVLAFAPGPLLFWTVVALSTVVSHAPATFRHRVLISSKAQPTRS